MTAIEVQRRADDINKMRKAGCGKETIRILVLRLYTDVLIDLSKAPRSDYARMAQAALSVRENDLPYV